MPVEALLAQLRAEAATAAAAGGRYAEGGRGQPDEQGGRAQEERERPGEGVGVEGGGQEEGEEQGDGQGEEEEGEGGAQPVVAAIAAAGEGKAAPHGKKRNQLSEAQRLAPYSWDK